MNEKNLDEIAYRRQAFKLFDRGKSAHQILRLIPRSRSWLFKWKHRFDEHGWSALDSLPKAPTHSPQAYDPSMVKLVLRVRARLARAKVGLVGARAVFWELKKKRLVKAAPSISTIKRWLRKAGCFQPQTPAKEAYYPAPTWPEEWLWTACDWVARYLEGGAKIFCFHTLDQRTHALSQTIATAKTTEVACAHLLHSSQELGLADVLQVDNDAAFTGLGRKARIFGRFVRLALYLGIELVFIPTREPKRNSLVERVNGLWASAFFDKDHFRSVMDLKRKRGKFLRWYDHYTPPALAGLSVKEASRHVRRRRLRPRAVERLPDVLPLVQGRIHFVRRVDAQGRIEILKERFRLSKRLRGEYVWATIDLKRQTLSVYHRRSAKAKAKRVKQYAYQIEERVEKVPPQFRRKRNRVNVLNII
jgi:transposase